MKGVTMALLFALMSGSAAYSDETTFDAVRGKTWRLIAVQTAAGDTGFSRQALEADGMGGFFSLSFDKERLNGVGAPNRYVAPYKVENDSLSIEKMASTLMASFREPKGLNEREYFAYMQQVKHWSLSGEELTLYSTDDESHPVLLFFVNSES
ncbi:MAG: META domain-containing protein [Treponema sp.]|jgi:heat shock protein HslJ|nr:META domain-containing protein [Treponema sp.]